jgi:hypothetical protein
VISDSLIVDVKSSFDIFTFSAAKYGKINKDYYWQLQGYMWLTGVENAELSYCLCNTPAEIILDEKKKLAWKMRCIDNESDEYIRECKYIERNSIYDMALFQYENPYFDFHSNPDDWEFDIPASERVHTFTVPFDKSAIIEIIDKVSECRKFMDTELFQIIPERVDIDNI